MNVQTFPLYYPIDTNNIGSDRRSLYDVLMKNIQGTEKLKTSMMILILQQKEP